MNSQIKCYVLASKKMNISELEHWRPIIVDRDEDLLWPHIRNKHAFDCQGRLIFTKTYQNFNLMINHGLTGKAKYIHLN